MFNKIIYSMYYIGIVGALSRLGKGVTAALQAKSCDYKIIFMVDAGYERADVIKSEFQNLEQVLTHNLTPSLVLDFGDSQQMYERAKFYRQNGFPDIMQGPLSRKDEEMLYSISRGSHQMPTPLVIVPDFSVTKVLMLKNLKEQVKLLQCKVNRIYVGLQHNVDEAQNTAFWLLWAQSVNEMLGEYTDKYCQKGHSVTMGFVRVVSKRVAEQDEQFEEMHLSIILSDDSTLKWEWNGNLLESRVDGVMRTLAWYVKRIKHDVNLASGDVLSDVLSKLL